MDKLTFLMMWMLFDCHGQHMCSKAYGYEYVQTTGITQFIVTDEGKKIPIQFSLSSNSEALGTLGGLKWNVLIPNANGVDMTLVGVLDKKLRVTPGGVRHAMSEEYQEFELHSWCISVPFRRMYWKDGVPDPGRAFLFEQKMHLDANDFEEEISGGKAVKALLLEHLKKAKRHHGHN